MANLNDTTLNTLSLLDAKLEDLADLPEWTTFPAGIYKCKPSVKIEVKPNKAGGKDTIITIGAKLLEIKEVADPAAVRVEAGAETSCRFTWENEFGQGALKKILAPIAELTKQSSVKTLLDILAGADDVIFVMDTRDSTNATTKKTTTYQVFSDLIVSP